MSDVDQTDTATEDEQKQASQTGDATGTNGGEDGEQLTLTKADLQKRIDDTVRERLERERKRQQTVREKEEAEAEKQRAIQAGEHEKVIQTQTKELEELRPVKEQAERYRGALESYLAEERKGVPKHVIPLLDKLDVVDQLEYIAANRAEFAKPKAPNLNGGERGGDGSLSVQDIKDKKRQNTQYAGI